jgi:trehalose 6-phosphate phosphatase
MMPNAISPMALELHEVAILLDVDGTILDLAPTPDAVQVPPSLRQTLTRLWDRTRGAIALVSGRPINALDAILAPLRLPTIGGHGAELRVAAGADPEPSRFHPLDPSVKRKFAAIAKADPGIVVEDKGYSLALHYRLAPDKEVAVRSAAAAICASLPTTPIELLPGKSMIEIKQTGFNKGTAVRELMAHSPFAGRRPLFVGDDVTDQDAFAIMREFDGIAISVGERLPGVAHCFERPADVRRWLEQISRNDVYVCS